MCCMLQFNGQMYDTAYFSKLYRTQAHKKTAGRQIPAVFI